MHQERLPIFGGRRSHLALVALLLGMGCGGRTVGIIPYGPRPDGSVPADAARPDDAEVAADAAVEGCWPPGEQVVIHSEGEPAFVHSLAAMRAPSGEGGSYLLGGSTGWQDLQGSLWILDQTDLSVVSRTNVAPGFVWASYDWSNDEIVAVSEEDNRVQLHRYTVEPNGSLTPVNMRLICNDCRPSWAGPVVNDSGAAVAIEFLSPTTVQLVILNREPLVVHTGPICQGGAPFVTSTNDGLLLIYQLDGQLYALPHNWTGEPVGQRVLVTPDPILGLLTASSRSGNAAIAVLVGVPDAPIFSLLEYDPITGYLDSRDVLDVVPYAMPMSISDAGYYVAITWGETYGAGRVGAHLLSIGFWGTPIVFGPERISEPLTQATATYSVWSAAAPHPDGHAVVFGGWQQQANYGIYGQIVPCVAFHETPPL